MRVSLSKSDRSFSVTAGQTVLDAALAARLNLPHSCKGGNCGACRARLLTGEIAYPDGPPLGLSDAEVKEGWILLCQARAVSNLCIDIVQISTADQVVTKRLPGRIERAQVLSHDVMAVFLRLPAAESFQFEPGQYIDIILSGGRRRSFSIASPPHAAGLLELHIRRVAEGEFTGPLFAEDAERKLLSIEGPLGQFYYRPSAAPMVLVGGGTGLAPLKSIIRHVLENDSPRIMTLYWGVRSERDLYAHEELIDWSQRTPRFRYHAVLSEPSGRWQGRRGWVHQAVLEDRGRLEGDDIYVCGPPAMIGAARREFVAQGADPARIYVDSFDYAPDTLERQRTRAATKS